MSAYYRDRAYYVAFAGKSIETTVTNEAAVVDDWVLQILDMYNGKEMVVGLDVEWKPNFYQSMNNKAATLQLCIDNKCLILQLFYMDGFPQSLIDFLGDTSFTFVGVEVDDDISKLRIEYGLETRKSADIRELAKNRYPGRFRRPGLKDLALEVCGLTMEKPRQVCMSNWEARVLNVKQIEYACIDAFAAYKIGHKLLLE